MVLAGAVILPHGALIFDGDPQSPSNECKERYRKMNSKMKEATVRVRLIIVEVYTWCIGLSSKVCDELLDLINIYKNLPIEFLKRKITVMA